MTRTEISTRTGRRYVGARVGRTIALVVIVLLAIWSVFPIVWLGVVSVMPSNAMLGGPTLVFQPTFEHYIDVFARSRDSIWGYLINSVIVTVVSTAVSVALAAMAAYAITRLKPRGGALVGMLILATRLLPPIALVVPFYVVFTELRVIDTQLALILPYTALSIPLATWLLQGFFLSLPLELEEAALVDGCTRMEAFIKIILPLSGPGIAVAAIMSFVLAWNDMLLALSLTLRRAATLPVLASQVRTDQGIDWGTLGAITMVMVVPAIVFTFAAQRWIIAGLTGGATKG